MAFGDNFEPDTGFGKGMHRLNTASIKFIKSQNGKDGIEIEYYLNKPDKTSKKWLWDNKFFNRHLSGWIVQLGLDPYELQEATRAGMFKEWLLDNIPNRHGNFMFCETEKVNEKTGKPFLEPKCESEVNLDEYFAKQKLQYGNLASRQSSNEPPMSAYENQAQSFVDDIPGEIPF